MEKFDVIVIGAGNAGLSAAATLCGSGLRTLVIEKHNVPGGCATSFVRGNFEFEVALHQLSGIGPVNKPGPLRSVLKSCGVLDKIEFVEMQNLYRIIVPGSLDITVPADRKGAEEVLCSNFPHEKEGILGFFDLVYRFFVEIIGAFYLNDPDMSRDKYPLFYEYSLKNSEEVLNAYIKDPYLRMIVASYWSYMGVPPSTLSFTDLAALLYVYIEWKPYHIKGGSQALSTALADEILKRGGSIRYNSEVHKILLEDGRVRGVELAGGEKIYSDFVLSNASSYSTYVDLLCDSEISPAEYENLKAGSPGVSALTLYIGLDCTPEEAGITETTNFICMNTDVEKAFLQCGRAEVEDDFMLLTCYNVSDPDAAPAGKSQVAVVTLKYGEPWMRVPPEKYHETKFRCADRMLCGIEKVFPGFRERIEELEIATPLTHMRYLGHPAGAIYGTNQHIKDSPYFVSPLSSVKGLYLAGSWAGPGGFQPTLSGGASAARALVKEFFSDDNTGGGR